MIEYHVTPPLGSSPNDPVEKKLIDSDAAALDDFVAPEPEVTLPTEAKEPEKTDTIPDAKLAESKPEEKVEPKIEEVDEIQKRLDEIQPKPNAHPNTTKGFKALKDIIVEKEGKLRTVEKEKKDLEGKLSSLETEYKGKVLTPELETELKDLRELRREFHIENDPEFQAKYSTKLKDADQKALGILKQSGLLPDMEKFIMDNGGVIAMYNSQRSMPGQYSGKTQQAFIEEVLMPRLPDIQRTRLQNAIAAGIDIRDEMSREIEHSKTHGSEMQQKRQQELQDKFNQSVLSTREQLGELAKKLEYPKDATPEQKKKIDKHNGLVDKAEKIFNEYMAEGSKNPAKDGDAFARAAASYSLVDKLLDKDAEIAERDDKIKELTERLEKVKGSGSTGKSTAAPPPNNKPIPGKLQSDEEALSAFTKGN